MIKLNDILNEDYPFDVYKKIEKLKGGALLRFGNEIWIKIGNRKDQWLCGKGPEKGVVSDSTVVAQRIAKSNKTLKIENKVNEATSLWKKFDAMQRLQGDIMDIEHDMIDITKELEQVHKDMEQEAEPEGGPKTTKYGEAIEKLEKLYKKKKVEFKKLMDKLEKLEEF